MTRQACLETNYSTGSPQCDYTVYPGLSRRVEWRNTFALHISARDMQQVAKPGTFQLFTTSGGKEFALKLKNDESGVFVAATHLGVDYPFLVEEFGTDESFDGWDALLQQRAEKWIADGSLREVVRPRDYDEKVGGKEMRAMKRPIARIRRIKPTIKCHFCCLMYITEIDRHEHEKMWHASKMQAGNPRAGGEIDKVNKIKNYPTLCEPLCAPQSNR